MLNSDGDGKGFGKQAARYAKGDWEISELHDAISDIRSQIVNELAKKELLRLNVDYVLFKEHEVQISYPISGCHPHTFWVELIPSDSLISREALTEDEESDPEFELVGETDTERREALLKSDKDADLSNKLGPRSSWKGLEQEFDFNNRDQTTSSNVPIDDIIDLSSDDDNDDHCNIAVASGSTFIHGPSNAAKGKGKFDPSDDVKENTSTKTRHPKSNAIGLGGMVKAEIDLRKKESLGMAPVKGNGRTLGSRSTGMLQNVQSTPTKWDCLVCTLSVTFCCSISLGVALIHVLLVRISQVICRALLAAHPVEMIPGHKRFKPWNFMQLSLSIL
jgi:hypothetical protein